MYSRPITPTYDVLAGAQHPYWTKILTSGERELRRGGTASGHHEKDAWTHQRKPASSHKYPDRVNLPWRGSSNHKVSIKGAGWSSGGTRNLPGRHPVKAYQEVASAMAKGSRFGKLHGIQEERTSTRGSSDDCRPPSRHKSPTKAISLELFERSPRASPQPSNARGNSSLNENSRPRTCQHSGMYDIPVIVTREECGKRRIFSAHKNGQKVKTIGPPKKGKQLNFCSSLGQDFIELFD